MCRLNKRLVSNRVGGRAGFVEVRGARGLVYDARGSAIGEAIVRGNRVDVYAGGRLAGYAFSRGDLVYHYAADNTYLGSDLIQGSRVLHYDTTGRIIAVTTRGVSYMSGSEMPLVTLAAVAGGWHRDRERVKAVQRTLKNDGYNPGEVDGVFGARTLAAIQEALKTRGFDPGPADGSYGPRTALAIKKFQSAVDLGNSGRLDFPTVLALLAGPSRRSSM